MNELLPPLFTPIGNTSLAINYPFFVHSWDLFLCAYAFSNEYDGHTIKKQDFTFGTILTNHLGKRNFLRRFG
ncbi:hypothetical protein PGS_00003940 [Porphyromonas gingivalis A7A1-28]|nr:hypothetical protein PGS_00003940 [Porphyromonas gingivalis A7A1-28]OWR80086.1 hypothetical protein SJDPG4_03095 [Porphyromonas gingivalis SJD4]SJL31161.1 hypothetical protein PGIN_A7A1-28_01390 [Porphyromonas gingivalis]